MTYDEHTDCDRQLCEAEDKIIKLQADNESLQSKIDLALKELAHIEGEKNPTEKRVYEALKNPKKIRLFS